MEKHDARKKMLKVLKGVMNDLSKEMKKEHFKKAMPKKDAKIADSGMSVTVGASSQEGLEEGLDLAKDLVAEGAVDKEAIKKKISGKMG
jgi:hypothetical protein